MMSGDPQGFEVLSGCQATESAPRKSGFGAAGARQGPVAELALLPDTGLLFGGGVLGAPNYRHLTDHAWQ
jgi:hypothetical protein